MIEDGIFQQSVPVKVNYEYNSMMGATYWVWCNVAVMSLWCLSMPGHSVSSVHAWAQCIQCACCPEAPTSMLHVHSSVHIYPHSSAHTHTFAFPHTYMPWAPVSLLWPLKLCAVDMRGGAVPVLHGPRRVQRRHSRTILSILSVPLLLCYMCDPLALMSSCLQFALHLQVRQRCGSSSCCRRCV